MIRIGAAVIIRRVAAGTSVRRIVVIPLVATVAIHGLMRALQRPETVVIDRRRDPTTFIVADHAIRGETSVLVIRIGGLIVIRCMATVACVRRIVIIAIVASCTIVGQRDMCAVERPEIIVDGEGSWHPIRIGSMTHGTIRR